MEAGRGGIWAVPLLTPLTSQVVSDTSEASATARQTAATAWRQVICSGKGRDSDREHSGSGREHSSSGSGSGSGSGSVCARALSPPCPLRPPPFPSARAVAPHLPGRPLVFFRFRMSRYTEGHKTKFAGKERAMKTSRPALQNRF